MLYSDQQGSSSGHSSDSQSPEDIDIDSELLPDADPEADRDAAEAGAERREAQDLGIDVYPAATTAGAAAGTVAVSAGGSSSGAASTSSARAQQQGGKRRYVGVRQRPSGRWVAEIKDTTHKIRLWLGTFNNPEDAARAYDDAARTLRGANTRTNFTRPVGTRPGFSSNSVRLLLQKAVEAAAVAGNLDSGGVLPSVAAAHAAGAAAAAAAGVVGHGLDVSSSAAAGVPSSFNATPAGGPQDADPSNYMQLGGLNPHGDIDLAMEAGSSRDVFSSSAMATDHLFAPGRHGISRSASYDHATMMRSQLQAPGSSSQSSLYSSASFSGDFDFSTGSQAAVTHASVGAFDLQQIQISNAGQVLQHPGATATSDQYQVRPPISIYKSLREKLGYAGGAAVGDSLLAFPARPGHHHGEGSATAFAVPRPGSGAAADLDRVDSMDLSWNPMMRPTSGHAQGDAASLIHHWSTRSGSGATTDMMMRLHDHEQPGLAMEAPSVPGGRTHDQSGAAAQVQLQAPESMSWDQHASVAAASRHETAAVGDHLQVDERFGMEEISVVNWGHLATASSTAADAASGERMDTLSPLNWEDLGTPMATTSSEQRPVERPTTINWGDLISGTPPGTSMATTATVEAQGMEGITSSWGNVERGQRGPAHHHGGMDFHAGQGLQATTGFAPAPASWTTSGHDFFTAPASASHGYELDRSYQFSTRPAGPSSQEYWGAEAAAHAAGHDHASAVANLDLRAPHDHIASQSGSISAQSAPNHPPAAEVAGSRAASYHQDDGWQTTSSRHPPYVQRSFHPTDHGARLLNLHDQQQPPATAASHGQEEGARSPATFQGSGSEQHQDTQLDSGAAVEQVQQGGDASSAETQQELQETLRLLDYTTIDPSSCDANSSFLPHTPADQSDAAGLNFLMLSPGFFRVDSFPRQHRPLTTSSNTAAANVLTASAAGDAATQRATDLDQDAHLPSTATAVPAASSKGSVSTMEARRDDSQESRRLPPALTGSGTPAAPEVSTQPTAGSSSESDPTLTLAHARPKLLRNNAGCLPEVTRDRDGPDGTHGRSLPSTGSQVIGEEAVRSQLMLAMGGSMISTQELVAATRAVSSGDPDVVHAPPIQAIQQLDS